MVSSTGGHEISRAASSHDDGCGDNYLGDGTFCLPTARHSTIFGNSVPNTVFLVELASR